MCKEASIRLDGIKIWIGKGALGSMNEAFKNVVVPMQPGCMEITDIIVDKNTPSIGWSWPMTSMQTIPSVRVTIWVTQGLNYSYTKKNANPEDEKKWWLRHTTLLARWAEPWVTIPQKSNNSQYIIRKKDISIMEFKWAEEDDD